MPPVFVFVIVRVIVPVIIRQLLGTSDAGNDVLHVIDVDGHRAFGFQFVKQLGDALLNVVGNFLAALLLAK